MPELQVRVKVGRVAGASALAAYGTVRIFAARSRERLDGVRRLPSLCRSGCTGRIGHGSSAAVDKLWYAPPYRLYSSTVSRGCGPSFITASEPWRLSPAAFRSPVSIKSTTSWNAEAVFPHRARAGVLGASRGSGVSAANGATANFIRHGVLASELPP